MTGRIDSTILPTHSANLINGRLVPGSGFYDVVNPSTGEVFAQAPAASEEDLAAAVAGARAAQPAWAADEGARRRVLLGVAEVLEANAEQIARLISLETGKPYRDALREPLGAAGHARWHANAVLPVDVIVDDENQRVTVERTPVGVVAAIIPWNVPVVMLIHKFAAASLAGNTVVAKPSPFTPLSALLVAALLRPVVPAGVLNVLSGGDELGVWLVDHPGTDMVAFTGSGETGARIMSAAAPRLKRLCLELGGNDAAIVLNDTDIGAVAPRLYRGAFALSGQICSAIKRLYVQRAAYPRVLEELTRLASQARPGDPFDDGTTMGPISTKPQLERVEGLVDSAVQAGGTVVAGGRRLDRPGYFYPPTLVTGLDPAQRLVAEEQFGPVLPIMVFDDVQEAIAQANATEFGLGASVWSADTDLALTHARRLNAGTVWVNRHAAVAADVPFGGVGRSGLGREGGAAGLESYSNLRTVSIDRS